MTLLSSLSLLFLPSFIWAKAQTYIDSANSTAWTFAGYFYPQIEPDAYNGSYQVCGASVENDSCTGKLTFRGSTVDIYGVEYDSIQGICAIDFSWPTGKTTYVMKGGFKDPFNVSFAHAEGFNPNEVSAVNFASKNCSARLDYAIVDAEDGVAPGSSSLAGSTTSGATIGATPGTTAFSSPKSKPPIGPIVGGVVGGVVIILMLLVAGVWIMRRRRKPIIPYNNQATPLTKEPETVLTPMPYRLSNTASTGASKNQGTEIVSSNSLATAAREKQALADRLDETQISSQGNGLSGGLVSSQHVPQTSNAEQPSAVGNTNPDVQARVAQLQAEIHEIQSRGALPPPY